MSKWQNKDNKMGGVTALIAVLLLIAISGVSVSTPPPLRSIVISADYEVNYTKTINTTIEYVFLYNESNGTALEGARIKVRSNATHDFPLIVVVRQKKGILSWQIPLLVQSVHFDTLMYNTTSRTLCSEKYYQSSARNEETFVTISISTASNANIFFEFGVSQMQDFFISSNEERNVAVSPAEPVYYGYTFSEKTDSRSVLVKIESDSDICMTVSIQNISCPVFDLERNIQFSGYWQTVSQRGGITVPKEAYPLGFFVVLVVKGDDTDCTGVVSTVYPRNKTVSLSISPNITKQDYIFASTITLSMFLAFSIFYIISIVTFRIKEARKLREDLLNDQEAQDNKQIPSPSSIQVGTSQWTSIEEDSSLDEEDIDILEDAYYDKEITRTKPVLAVCDLARKDPRILRRKSHLYLYYLGTVAIFYTLPVVQLVVTYQNVLHVTGNQDLCYYNFLCSHPLGLLSDFNHVYSNFGYILLGLLFVLITYTRNQSELNKEEYKGYGIPQHYGMFYAMGTALMMEGVLSGSYHVCPNHSNFQFDTSFMYIMTVLCMVKIYQTRHPDINARASVTFGVLALTIFLGLIGVLDGSNTFWIIFTVIHLFTCLFLTIQIYYMGRWRLNRGIFRRIVTMIKLESQAGIIHLLRPIYVGRLVLLVIANACNIVLAIFGNMHHEKDFATYLLAVLMANLLLYMFFYIIMKLCYGERIRFLPLIYIILAILTWAAALYFFIHKSISWAFTPAQSRIYNKPCQLFHFFDSHDIWHFLSAFAMFFSFMVLLTLDDDLIHVHRSQIPVF